MMGVLMDNGIKASKAGTGLRKVFSKLNEEGVPFTSVLEDMASGQMTLNDATALVGETASNQLLILSNNLDKVNELTNSYETNTTALGEMAAKMESTTQGKIKKMQSAINELQIVFGELLVERLLPVIQKITDLANKFSDLDKSTQNTIIDVLGIAAAFGVLLLAVAALVPLLALLKSGLMILGGVLAVVLAPLLTMEALAVALLVGVSALAHHYGGLQTEAEELAKAQRELNKEMDDFRMLNAGSGTALSEIQKGIIAAKEAADELFLSKRALNNQGAIVSTRTITSVGGDSGESELRGGRVDVSAEEIQYSRLELTKFGVQLGITGEQIMTLNQLGTDMLSNFADGFVNLFEKQTRFVEINGVMQEQTIGFGEKFGNFASQFLIDIAKMIAKTAILAGLLQLTGLGTAKTFGGNFMNILGFADGGRPPVGRPSIVGERGPELFVPGSSGTIIPNHALGGGGAAAIPDVRISGDDLLIVFDRANRRKGYR